MCGIAGVIGQCSFSLLEAMADKMKHRGPDNLSTLSFGDVHLAHARLSIIDLSPKSNQPLWDIKKQVCIVFNGEIYNYKTLRQNLLQLNYQFSSLGDAEVILNLYLEYGPACLEQLSGIFAFALWDARSQELLVARDVHGVKPLYYSQNEKGFYFASEMKSILVNPDISRALNADALLKTVVFLWSPGPQTIVASILKLEPGHYLIVKNRKIVKKAQYESLPSYHPQKMSKKEGMLAVQDALTSSIKEQLVSDVPIGSFLSGGLDSSLIVAMAKATGADLECFTIDALEPGDETEGFVDDLPYAKKVADYLHVKLNILTVKPDVVRLLSKMIYHLDEPQADPAPLNVGLIAELARKKGIKVLFSGAGGDDVFTGYRRHVAVRLERYWCWLPKIIRQFIQLQARQLKKKNEIFRRLSKLFSYAASSENERILSYFYWISPETVRGLLTPNLQSRLSEDPMHHLLDELAEKPTNNKLEKMLYLEQRYFLVDHNLNYTDKMSMAHGVEVRVPFLDKRVMQVASGLHTSLKQRGTQGKWILKKMAERYLPKSIIYRSKSGFGAPLQRWLKEDLKSLVDDLLGEASLARRGLFNPEAVQNLIEQDRSGKEYYSYPIFALVCIELWCRIFIDGELVPDVQDEAHLQTDCV